MINVLAVILFLLLDGCLIGCATRPQPYGAKDPYFAVFIHEYIKAAKKYNIDEYALTNDFYSLIIRFDDDIKDPNILAYYSSFNHEIVIDREEWFKMDYYTQEQLMAHEITHALFGANHINDMSSSMCSGSIMNTYLYRCYTALTREYYLKRLFTKDIFYND